MTSLVQSSICDKTFPFREVAVSWKYASTLENFCICKKRQKVKQTGVGEIERETEGERQREREKGSAYLQSTWKSEKSLKNIYVLLKTNMRGSV